MLLIRGANLMNGEAPRVTIQGEPVEVVEASPSRLLVRPLAHHREGQFEIQVGDERTSGFFEMPLARIQIEEEQP
jgi:hypothetical protein